MRKGNIFYAITLGVLAIALTAVFGQPGLFNARINYKFIQKKNEAQPVEDKSIIDKIKKEEGVKYAYVDITYDVAFSTIIVKNEVTKERAKELVEKYGSMLYSKYPDKEISIEAKRESNEKIGEWSIKK